MLACYRRNLNSPTVGELARSTWLHSDVSSADSEGRSASCLLFDFALSTKEAERGQPFTHRPTPALVYVSAAVPAGCTPARSDDPRSGHWQGEVIGTEDGAGCKAGRANSEKTDGFLKKCLKMEIKQAWRLRIRTWRREVLKPLWSHLKRSAREGREPFYPLTAAVPSPQHTHTLSSQVAQLTRGQWSSCCLLNTHTYACCMHAHTDKLECIVLCGK